MEVKEKSVMCHVSETIASKGVAVLIHLSHSDVFLGQFPVRSFFFLFENWGIQLFCLISRANVVLELLKSRLEVRYNALRKRGQQILSSWCRRRRQTK